MSRRRPGRAAGAAPWWGVPGIARAALVAGLAWALSAGAAAWALEVTVDPAGGSLTLEEDVAAALADWRAAGVDVDAAPATVTVRYGPAGRFGPDVVVWVLLRDGAFEVLVAPDLADANAGDAAAGDAAPGDAATGARALPAGTVRAALIPALGVVLGGSLGGGALDPVLDVAGPRRPTAAEGVALEARRTAVPGDLNRDGRVDFEDLLLLAEAFGRRGVNLPADLDGSGEVDAADLDVLREAYTFDPPTVE